MELIFSNATVAVVWIVFSAAVLLDVVIGGLLYYHWARFSMSPVITVLALTLYSACSIVLLSSMFLVASSI